MAFIYNSTNRLFRKFIASTNASAAASTTRNAVRNSSVMCSCSRSFSKSSPKSRSPHITTTTTTNLSSLSILESSTSSSDARTLRSNRRSTHTAPSRSTSALLLARACNRFNHSLSSQQHEPPQLETEEIAQPLSMPRRTDVELRPVAGSFNRCSNLTEVLELVDRVPVSGVDPVLVSEILQRVGELESDGSGNAASVAAIFDLLIGKITSKKAVDSGRTLFSFLKYVNYGVGRSHYRRYVAPHRRKLIRRISANVANNAFSVAEVCGFVEQFHIQKNGAPGDATGAAVVEGSADGCMNPGAFKDVDNLAFVIAQKIKSVDAATAVNVFRILPCFHLERARQAVAKALTRRLADVWPCLQCADVVEILRSMRVTRLFSYNLLQSLGYWLCARVHALDATDLIRVLAGFSDLNFVSDSVIAALEQVEVPPPSPPAIGAVSADYADGGAALLLALLDYCRKFRVRSAAILEKACDHFLLGTDGETSSSSFTPGALRSLIVTMGHVQYTPTRSYEFWRAFERVFEAQFDLFEPDHVVDAMLACVLLGKYPLNFVSLVFDPHFLRRLQATTANWLVAKNNLSLVSHTMHMHCDAFETQSLLPAEFPPSFLYVDAQLKETLLRVSKVLVAEYGDEYRVHVSKILRSCPKNHGCLIDVYMEPAAQSATETSTRRRAPLALLVQMPQNYTYDGGRLVGLQQLRIGHLRSMGIKVANIDYLDVLPRCSVSAELGEYLSNIIDDIANVEETS